MSKQMLKNLAEMMIEAWFNRTLPVVNLDTGEKTPPPTREEWSDGVKNDLNKLIVQAYQDNKTTKKHKIIKLSKKNIKGDSDIDYPRALLFALVGKYGVSDGLKRFIKDSK